MNLRPLTGPIAKTNHVRLPAMLKASNGRSCVRCGAFNETVVFAHYTGLQQHRFGKGRGIKCHDCCGADLCSNCHRYFDEYQGADGSYTKKIELSEEFLTCCMLTMIRNFQEGVIVTTSGRKKYH